jgi:crotonobetainyl-CoA:carnitine CoA-transferase CaiB-like acyl-CoA transferase
MVDGVGNSAMLAGVRVLDFATPAYLVEFGADVIEVEQPTGGDLSGRADNGRARRRGDRHQ